MVEHPGGESEVQAVHNAHNENVPQPPTVGGGAGGHPVLGQGNHCTVIKHRQQHNQNGGEVPASRDTAGVVYICDE